MLFCCFLSGAGLNQVTSTFWDGTQSLLGGEQATILHLKEDSQGFKMIPFGEFFFGEIGLIQALSPFKPGPPRTELTYQSPKMAFNNAIWFICL